MADFFESTLAGIRMAAKAGKKRRALRNITAFAGRAYMNQIAEPLRETGKREVTEMDESMETGFALSVLRSERAQIVSPRVIFSV